MLHFLAAVFYISKTVPYAFELPGRFAPTDTSLFKIVSPDLHLHTILLQITVPREKTLLLYLNLFPVFLITHPKVWKVVPLSLQ